MKIEWDERAFEALAKLDRGIAKRIVEKIDEMVLHNKGDIKRLKGCSESRLRIGDYRVIFSLEKDSMNILKLGHRKNIYK